MIQEFVCPNGRMSVNGVCPIFEGDDGQIKDFKKKSTYDALKEDEIFGEKDIKEEKGIFEFDFEKPTESAFESADNIIKNNITTYQNFVSDKLGISPKVQTFGTFASMAYGLSGGGGALAIAGPLVIPFIMGNALKNKQKKIDNRNLKIDEGIAASDNDDNIGYAAPAKTSQGVTSAQHAAFRM